ncbi:MAG: aminoglycoside 6-adenylyltransferase [Coprothermobacterota bacterium]|nr:aminoglycoside 6-adenylyltransferase [Coprothermobacterota bacterium]
MDLVSQGYETLIHKFVEWAQKQEDIRLAFVLGSRARTDHPADVWSDLDLAIVTRDIRPYIERADWIHNIGKAWLTFLETTNDTMERRVLFDGGLDVDFAMIPLEMLHSMLQQGVDSGIADIFRRGVRVLLDKDNLLPDPGKYASAWKPPDPPVEAEFLQVVNDFWYHAVWTAKHVRRGELWWGKSCCDDKLKSLLRQVLEWHAHATMGPGHDTWLRGRFLEEWADPLVIAQLSGAFAHYDQADVWRALAVTMDLFRKVSLETAKLLGYSYPTGGADYAEELVSRLSQGFNWGQPLISQSQSDNGVAL